MSEEAVSKHSVLDELKDLAGTGARARIRTKIQAEYLKECRSIAALILEELDLEGSLADGGRIAAVGKVLTGVAGEAMGKAIRPTMTPKEDPHSAVAAAAELLGITDETKFDERRRKLYPKDYDWSQRLKAKDSRGPRRQRQLRASIWIEESLTTARRRELDLLEAFKGRIIDYVERYREELAGFVAAHLDSVRLPVEDSPPTELSPPKDGIRPTTALQVDARPTRRVDPNLQGIKEELADQVRQELEDEQRQDKATTPVLMPVRWSITTQYPVDHPSNIWGESDSVGAPLDTGTVDTAADLFESILHGRLVILGTGGAGKTVLARELALKLLERRTDAVVPVIFRLSSWDLTEKISLRDWMADQLVENYPALEATIQGTQGGRTTAAALVHGRHVLPILDGLVGQPQLVISFLLSLVVALTGSVLVASSPV